MMMADPQTIDNPPLKQQQQQQQQQQEQQPIPQALFSESSSYSSSRCSSHSRSGSTSPVRGSSSTAWDSNLNPLLELLRLRLLKVMKTESVEDGGGDGGGGGGGGGEGSEQTRVMVDSSSTSTTTVTDTPDETTTKTSTSKFTKTTKVKTIKIVKKRNSLVANAINDLNRLASESKESSPVRKLPTRKSDSPKKFGGLVKKATADLESSESNKTNNLISSKADSVKCKPPISRANSRSKSPSVDVKDSSNLKDSTSINSSIIKKSESTESQDGSKVIQVNDKKEPKATTESTTSESNEVSDQPSDKNCNSTVSSDSVDLKKEVQSLDTIVDDKNVSPSKVKLKRTPSKEANSKIDGSDTKSESPKSRIIRKKKTVTDDTSSKRTSPSKSVSSSSSSSKDASPAKVLATSEPTENSSPSKTNSSSSLKDESPVKMSSKDSSPSKVVLSSTLSKDSSPVNIRATSSSSKDTSPAKSISSKETSPKVTQSSKLTSKEASPSKIGSTVSPEVKSSETTTADATPTSITVTDVEASPNKLDVDKESVSSLPSMDKEETSTPITIDTSNSSSLDSPINTTKKTKSSSSLSTRPKTFNDVPKISKTKSTDAVGTTKLKIGTIDSTKKAISADNVNLEKAAVSSVKPEITKENMSLSKSTLSSIEDVASHSVASTKNSLSNLSECPSSSDVPNVAASITVTSESEDHADPGSSSCEAITGNSDMSKTSDPDSLTDSEIGKASVFIIVRDMSGLTATVNKVTIFTPATLTCGELMQQVGRCFKYEPDSFSLVLQCSDGSQVELEKMEADRTLQHARFQVEGTPRNNLILCDLGGQPPRRTDEDDLSLGASASPTANATEKKWFDKSTTNYESTTKDYSYSSALIKQDTGYVGLVNQAMTCYLNSLLQTLYMTPEFRNALYHWEFKGTEEEASKNIPCQLQRLFLLLQTTNKSAVETTNLTRSFGWDSSEAWQQHDIQELCRVMFDALEQCFKKTHQSNLINDLYEGKMSDYVKCLECGNEGAREDTYLDVPLPIRPFGSTTAYKSVEEALKSFVEPELLTGNNKYKCSKCNSMCDAHKGLKFTHFPYLLTIHLMRFDFDYTTLHRIKLNDKVTFPNILDLNSFVKSEGGAAVATTPEKTNLDKLDDASTTDSGSALDVEDNSVENTSNSLHESDNQEEDEGIDVSSIYNEKNKSCPSNGPYSYELFSIMVHSGSASGGHYYAYIKDFRTGEWFCFNDQNVSKITYDDIRKTYGGSSSSRGGYYSSWSSSANAYMLMYRQITKERNVYAFSNEELPQHIKDLVQKMTEVEAAEREQREIERCMCRIKLFCQVPGQTQMVEKKLRIHKDSTLRETTQQAYEELNLKNTVPIERCRLVKYEEFHDSLECSYEGQEEELISEILGGVKSSYKFDLLMEIRDEDKVFEVYKPGGTTIKAYIINLDNEEVEGPYNLRGSLLMTVQELKELVGRSLKLNPDTMRIVLERYYNDLRPLSTDSKTLKLEGFYRSNKIYVEASGKEPSDVYTGSWMYHILERYENTITLYCPLPDTSKEALEELQIPPFKEEETDVGDAVISTSVDSSSGTSASFADSPADSAASPASCSSKDSGISSKCPNDVSRDMGSSSNSSILSNSSYVNITSPSTSSSTIPSPGASSTSQDSTSSIQGTSTSTNVMSSFATSAGNGSDGEDEGIVDADSGAGSSNVNSDQSASEDSSLTSDSDRTLVGEPPEDKLSDASNSPDYRNVSSPEDNSRDTKDTEVGWTEDEKEVEAKRYFRAEYFTEEETNQKMLRIHVDKRITIGQLKTRMQKWVGVSCDHFKLFKIYSNSQEFECTRMTETLTSYGDNTRLNIKLGRALLPGEQRGKVYLLQPENTDDPARFLIDWVICKGDTVANAKKAIVREVNNRCNMTLDVEQCRIRKKSWKNPQTIYLNEQKFDDDDISFYSNWELFLQVIGGPEPKSRNPDELALFIKRWKPSDYTTSSLSEIIISTPTAEALKEKISEVSGIGVEDVVFAKGKGTFPCDMSVMDLDGGFDWTPRSGPLDQQPLYIFDDGDMIYYKDKTEKLKELSDDERRELTSSENRRLNRDLQYACPSSTTSNYSSLKSKEKGLKIYLNHDD